MFKQYCIVHALLAAIIGPIPTITVPKIETNNKMYEEKKTCEVSIIPAGRRRRLCD
jgi:hypothetical protein